ncbi:MAG: lipoyl(octanoyl) transferase LipB [Planctomycetota bacterium]
MGARGDPLRRAPTRSRTGGAVLEIRRIPLLDYREGLALQDELAAERARDAIPDTLVLLEHPSVLTAGRGTPRDLDLDALGLPVHRVPRGGDLTWHGPGQLVGYWIRRLEGRDRDLHLHLRRIESALIAAVARFGVEGTRREGLTGVWVGARKIASVGVGVRNWVTRHGFGLNREVDPARWGGFRPCGLDGETMSDLARLAPGGAPSRAELEDAVAEAFTTISEGPSAPGDHPS